LESVTDIKFKENLMTSEFVRFEVFMVMIQVVILVVTM